MAEWPRKNCRHRKIAQPEFRADGYARRIVRRPFQIGHVLVIPQPVMAILGCRTPDGRLGCGSEKVDGVETIWNGGRKFTGQDAAAAGDGDAKQVRRGGGEKPQTVISGATAMAGGIVPRFLAGNLPPAGGPI